MEAAAAAHLDMRRPMTLPMAIGLSLRARWGYPYPQHPSLRLRGAPLGTKGALPRRNTPLKDILNESDECKSSSSCYERGADIERIIGSGMP